MIGGGTAFRILRGDIPGQSGLQSVAVGLVMLGGGIAAFRGKLWFPAGIFAVFIAITSISFVQSGHLLAADLPGGALALASQLAIPVAALVWILARRFFDSRAGRAVASAATLVVVAAFLASLPGMAAGIGQGVAMLVNPPPARARVGAGERLPDVRFRTAEGDRIRPDAKDAVYVLNFWATWCVPCRMELPEIMKLDEELRRAGDVRLMAVNTEDLPGDKLLEFVRNEKLDGLPVFAVTGPDKALIGVETIPMTLVVQNRMVLLRTEGFSEAGLEKLKETVLAALGAAAAR